MAAMTQDPEAWARLGVKIRERREALGMSRRQLSEEAAVSEKSIQVAEEGRTPRARWPQSLRFIESALRWQPGSMQNILDGGEPEPFLEQELLFPLDDGPEELPGVDDGFPSNHARSAALARLPRVMRADLESVFQFGRRAGNHGADYDLVEEYEQAVEALLGDLTSRPVKFVGYHQDHGRLAHWEKALRMDPMLRRQREERLRAEDRERRYLAEKAGGIRRPASTDRTPVVGGTTDAEVLNELRMLAKEVARLSEKVDGKESDSPAE